MRTEPDVLIAELPITAAELTALEELTRRLGFGSFANAMRTALWKEAERQGMNLEFFIFAARGPDTPDVARRRETRRLERR